MVDPDGRTAQTTARRASPWNIEQGGPSPMRAGWEKEAGASPARGSSELQQLADLNMAVGWQPVGPLEGGVHVGQIHDVEGLNLPLTLADAIGADPTRIIAACRACTGCSWLVGRRCGRCARSTCWGSRRWPIATPRSSPQTHGCRRLPSADKMVASHLTPRQGGCHGALLDYRGRCADADAG